MKLLYRNTFFQLLIYIIVFGIGGIVTFQIIKREVDLETDRFLYSDLIRVMNSIKKGAPIEALNNDQVIIVEVFPEVYIKQKPQFADTMATHPRYKHLESYRRLSVVRSVNDRFFHIKLIGMIVEKDDIYNGVVESLSWTFAILVFGITLATYLLSKWLFRPFVKTLSTIEKFQLKDSKPITFNTTSIQEFRELNAFLERMTTKVQQDYQNLKEFTENASHEMQTPLAIAEGKLEILLDDPDLDESQSELIASAYMAIKKISKLGHSLALLSKIENQEFSNSTRTDFSELVETMTINFRELIGLKEINLITDIQEDVRVTTDPYLGDILITNLFQNAVRHNKVNGKIEIHLTEFNFTIRNTGPAPKIPLDQLFNRFKKNNPSSQSLGLGLAIVYKICEVNGWEVSYEYMDGWHEIRIDW